MREALGIGGYAVIAVGVDSFGEGDGRVEGGCDELLDAVDREANVEAAVQDGGGVHWSGARARASM